MGSQATIAVRTPSVCLSARDVYCAKTVQDRHGNKEVE